jgi:hypothetical protein
MNFDDVVAFDNRDVSHNDPAYLSWLKQNSKGFVINTDRSYSIKTMRLHLATCDTIRVYQPKVKNPGAFTEGTWIKICSLNIHNLHIWVSEHGHPINSRVTPCGLSHCQILSRYYGPS